MIKQIVTTIAILIFTHAAFGQTVLKDELASLKGKNETAYQQAEQAKLDQIAVVNRKYLEVLKQLLLKAKVSSSKDSQLLWDIKRELATLGHFEPEDWYFGIWKLHRPGYGEIYRRFDIDFNGSVYSVDSQTNQRKEFSGNTPVEILSDSKVTFKSYRDVFEVVKVSTGKVKFILVTDRSNIEIEAVRE